MAAPFPIIDAAGFGLFDFCQYVHCGHIASDLRAVQRKRGKRVFAHAIRTVFALVDQGDDSTGLVEAVAALGDKRLALALIGFSDGIGAIGVQGQFGFDPRTIRARQDTCVAANNGCGLRSDCPGWGAGDWNTGSGGYNDQQRRDKFRQHFKYFHALG